MECDNWKAVFFTQVSRYPDVFFNHHVFAYFKAHIILEIFNSLERKEKEL